MRFGAFVAYGSSAYWVKATGGNDVRGEEKSKWRQLPAFLNSNIMGISLQAFAKINRQAARAPSTDLMAAERPKAPGVILGIDPALRRTGFGVIRALRQSLVCVEAGTIQCSAKWHHSQCLLTISDTLDELIRSAAPEICVVEGLFFAKNLKTALIMGQVRGACIVSASRAGLPVYEIAARKVKQAIVGYGGAQKIAVAKMVERLLSLESTPSPDAADALALALAFALESQSPLAKPTGRI